MRKCFLICIYSILFYFPFTLAAQQNGTRLSGYIADDKKAAIEAGTVSLLKAKDSSVTKITAITKAGFFEIDNVTPGNYVLSTAVLGFERSLTPVQVTASSGNALTYSIFLQPRTTSLTNVTVTSQKPLIEMKAGVTIVNVEASISNVGATALEVLEKSPGVSVDKDGNISLKGKQNVVVWLDGKPTYLAAADLATMLSSLPASQLEQIEIMTNPTAKYDAAGSTGIIHIKTKKNRTQGFNGSVTLAYGQGRYYKTNNSVNLNYRNAKFNTFLTYTYSAGKNFTDIYALRTYYAADNVTVKSYYEQPGFLYGQAHNNSIKTGMDFFLSRKTTVGFALSGTISERTSGGNSPAYWMNAAHQVDSALITTSDNNTHWKNGAANINLRHSFSKTQELAVDLDYLGYNIENNQYFQNQLTSTGTTDVLKGYLPSEVNIYSAKADYTQNFSNGLKFESGWKSARVNTDNLAQYYDLNAGVWTDNLDKSNHFIYHETINAAYINLEKQQHKITLQGGLRFENTNYDATQRGNALRKDSSFAKQYASLFPSALMTIQVDSNHSFSLSAGRRIDRPPFQKLNPFVFVINKYTYQEGNPYIRPQFTWNFELTHNYKGIILTTLSYSYTHDYFSQIFPIENGNIIVYTDGNLGKMQNFGVSFSTQFQPVKIWSMNFSASFNYKEIEGYVYSQLSASLTQMNMNMSNQFRFKHGWSMEVSGFYNTSGQELQEIQYPTGQLAIGFSKQLLKNKATLKVIGRDVLYTQAVRGFTNFDHATEYFNLTRDSRVCNIAFTWRFGKTFKETIKRSAGSAADESKRMGNNN